MRNPESSLAGRASLITLEHAVRENGDNRDREAWKDEIRR